MRLGVLESCGIESLIQAAEKVESMTSAAKAANENKAFIAALEALRHPKPNFFRSLLTGAVLADAGEEGALIMRLGHRSRCIRQRSRLKAASGTYEQQRSSPALRLQRTR